MILALLLGACHAAGPSAADESPAPNIVLIMTDDQRWDTLEFMPIVSERLVRHGITYTNAYVTTPNCCPARAGFLTGDLSQDHGVYTNGGFNGGADAYRPTGSVSETLKAAGYATGLFGKYLTNYSDRDNGAPIAFDEYLVYTQDGLEQIIADPEEENPPSDTWNYFEWFAVGHDGFFEFGTDEQDYSTDVFTRETVAFVERHGTSSDPFFVQYSPYAPHLPSTPAPRHAGLTDSYDRDALPPSYGVAPNGHGWPFELLDTQWVKRGAQVEQMRDRQIASLQAVDEGIAQILDALERTGELANTIVIFTSDNGYSWGEHQWASKLCPYEECLRIPLVIADFRDSARAEAPAVNEEVVTNLDVAATITQAAGQYSKQDMPNATPLLLPDGALATGRASFLIEMYGAGNGNTPLGMPAWQGIRAGSLKYIRFSNGNEALFDLSTDPWELTNLVDDGEYIDAIQDLRARAASGFEAPLDVVSITAPALSNCIDVGENMTLILDPTTLPRYEDILTLQMYWEPSSLPDAELLAGIQATLNVRTPVGSPDRGPTTGARVSADRMALPVRVDFFPAVVASNPFIVEVYTTVAPELPLCVRGDIEIVAEVFVR